MEILRWATRTHDQSTRQMLSDDAHYFLRQSVSTPCLSTIARADGAYIEDTQGRKYLDFHGNNVHHIGYGHHRLKSAIARQMDELPFAPRRFACEPATALAKKLTDIAPGNLSKVLFTTGGSSAVEVAMKIARAATGRHKTISFWDAFHGAGFGAASVGGEQMFRSHAIGPLLSGTQHVAPFDCYRCPYGYPDINGKPQLNLCKLTCANFVKYVLEKEGDVAAVIAEPARAVPYIPPPGFWAVPDILVLGKALGGGILPLAAVLTTAELDVGENYAFGHYTHEKNPVSAAAGLTTIQIIEDENLVDNAAKLGEIALQRLGDMQDRHSVIGDIRGRGFLFGVELVSDRETKTPANDLAEAVFYRCLDKGLSFKISMGNTLTFTPPLILTEEQLDFALSVIEESIVEECKLAGLDT